MSLDGGGISNGPGAQDTASAVEEDYCLHARERFHHQWMRSGVFSAGALRLYGVTGEPSLLRAIKQTRMLAAAFGTCFLGHFSDPAATPAGSAAELPFSSLLLGPVAAPEMAANTQLAHAAWCRSVASTWDVLQMPSEWCQAMNGVVTEAGWGTAGQRHRIREQLELAGFMCLRAVQVPLPFYAMGLPWSEADDDDEQADEKREVGECVDDAATRRDQPNAATASCAASAQPQDEETRRNIRVACLAADILLDFIRHNAGVKVWVRCDGCNAAHRYQLQRLRHAVLYGYTTHKTAENGVVYSLNPACGITGVRKMNRDTHTSSSSSSSSSEKKHASGRNAAEEEEKEEPATAVRSEASSSLMALLYFSAWHPRMLLPSEWFGEEVVCFECPPAALIFSCLAPHGVTPQQHPHYRPNAAAEDDREAAASASAMANDPARSFSALQHSIAVTEGGGEEGEEEEQGEAVAEDALDADEARGSPARLFDARHHRPLFATQVVPRRSPPAHTADTVEAENEVSAVLSATNYSLGDWAEDLMNSSTPGARSPAAAANANHAENRTAVASVSAGASLMTTPAPSESAGAAEMRRQDAMQQRYAFVMPTDLQDRSRARWASGYPPLVSLLTFLVELMRRRAMPLFDHGFLDQYPLLNYLYFKAVEEPTRDVFASYEGQLQLPLQPLGHQLSSGVYEVFERDARKYRQYRDAVFCYVKDWFAAGPDRQHARQNADFFRRHGVMLPVPMPSADERVLHLVLLGCGRGPLIDECLNAVSALGVRLRIFAIEKNRPAAAFTRMRWANDPEWAQLAHTFGHSLEVVVADGRSVASAAQAGRLALPPDFGLCDVVVSELLGSFGDNELSPECLESFHAQLRQVQEWRGIERNPHLVCIPQRYTAWVAPLMSASLESAVAEAAVKGLTVAAEDCPDHHAALYHSLLVSNLSRGVALAEPQPCWTFTHDFTHDTGTNSEEATSVQEKEKKKKKPVTHSPEGKGGVKEANDSSFQRHASLAFQVPPCGRCSAFAGYFSCVLYESPTSSASAVTIATAPRQRTEDMYSWFPCAFTLHPSQQAELHDVEASSAVKSGVVTIHAELSRRVSASRRRVWYEWTVRYSYAAVAADAEATGEQAFVHNRNGWASSMLL